MTQSFENQIVSFDAVLKQIAEHHGITLENLNKGERLYFIRHIAMSILNDMKGETTKCEHPDFKDMCKRSNQLVKTVKGIKANVSTENKEALLVAIVKDIDRKPEEQSKPLTQEELDAYEETVSCPECWGTGKI
ncbi:hypothetical protein [Nostoc sp.]|uniref:hypothetical protein n=1 Tax=Nostoc sp. TaxID=1180 RepID=UPI002FF4CBF7